MTDPANLLVGRRGGRPRHRGGGPTPDTAGARSPTSVILADGSSARRSVCDCEMSDHEYVWQHCVPGRWRPVPMSWWPSDDAVRAVIDGKGPWPSLSPVSNGVFVPFDVDKYDGLAVVVGYGRNRKGREVLGSDEFQQNEAGTWEHLAGGGNGWSPRQRWDLLDGRDSLHLRTRGSSGKSPFDARREFSFAVFSCGPAVTTVEVDRRKGKRIADVSAGPGWLTVLWTPDDHAEVSAYTADGRHSFLWTSADVAA